MMKHTREMDSQNKDHAHLERGTRAMSAICTPIMQVRATCACAQVALLEWRVPRTRARAESGGTGT